MDEDIEHVNRFALRVMSLFAGLAVDGRDFGGFSNLRRLTSQRAKASRN